MAEFKHCESFKHLYAKKLLIEWLRDLDENNDFCVFGEITWRSNWGVHEELPFYEKDDPFYFEVSDGLKEGCNDQLSTKHYNHQEFFYPFANRGKLLFIPDITIFHKGSPKYLIEVVNKNDLNLDKILRIKDFFDSKGTGINLFTISADHILGQIEKPNKLNFTQILSTDYRMPVCVDLNNYLN